jgi:hypothetical protein
METIDEQNANLSGCGDTPDFLKVPQEPADLDGIFCFMGPPWGMARP